MAARLGIVEAKPQSEYLKCANQTPEGNKDPGISWFSPSEYVQRDSEPLENLPISRFHLLWRRPEICRRAGRLGEDDPGPAAEGDIGPQPVERHDNAGAEADQEENMGETPDQPGRPAGEHHPTEIRHGIVAPDGCKAALMAVAEWRRRGRALHARPNHARGIGPHLLRRRGHARRELSIPALRSARVADGK